MPNRFRSHLRHNVVAYLALFLALGGTAVAAKPLITGADIQDESVTGADVQDDSLTGADVLESSLGQVSSAGSANFALIARHVGGVRQSLVLRGTPLHLFEIVHGVQISVGCVAGVQLELSFVPDREPPDVAYGFTLDDTAESEESGFFTRGDIFGGVSVDGGRPVVSLVVGSGRDLTRVELSGEHSATSDQSCEILMWQLQSPIDRPF